MRLAIILCTVLCLCSYSSAQTTRAAAATDKLPFIHVDREAKRVVIDCEAVNAEVPLEFVCVMAGTAEHETLLRTSAKPSDIHLALLMLGLTPGEPIRYSPATEKWLPPSGHPLQISVQFSKGGRNITTPAYKLLRELKTKKPMAARTWIFAGSKVYNTGQYAADITGYVVTLVNFDLALIDVPYLASSSNELLEYELNPDVAPETGAKVKMIIEPAGAAALVDAPTTSKSVSVDQVRIDRLREQWQRGVATRAKELQDAATEHYQVINELRAEQNRLIDEAERIGRVIDDLERRYQDITVPRPATQEAEKK